MEDAEDVAAPGYDTVYKPSFVLIAIDTDPSMFVKKEGTGTTPFRSCLEVCYNLANSLIFTQNKRSWSPFGIVLALEDASASFVDFNQNILSSIKFLKKQREVTDDELVDMYQRKSSLDLSAFFLLCKKKFKEVKSVFYKRTIIYITNDDNPVRGDKNQRFAAINEAKNFEANNISFEMVTMKSDFDYKIFYNEMFSVMKTPLVETIIEDEEGLEEKLSSLILVRFYQRKVSFFPFVGDSSRFLKVKLKSYIQEEKLYNNAHISKSGKPLNKVPRKVANVRKKYLLKGSKNVLEFDADEYLDIRANNLGIGYTLIYVSDRVTDVGYVLTDTVILESDPKEDLQHFDSFWQYCVDKDKVLICAKKSRSSDKYRFVELIPKFVNNAKVFIIKTIPFNDEIKYRLTKLNIEEEDTNGNYSETKTKVTNELIDNLTFDYDPKMFINPASAKKKAFLRSKFLDEPQDEVEDVTLDSQGIDKNVGTLADTFKSLFHLNQEKETKKRKAPATGERGKKKK